MANRESPKTFVLLGKIVGADFGRIKLLLMTAVSKVLEISATHIVMVVILVVSSV